MRLKHKPWAKQYIEEQKDIFLTAEQVVEQPIFKKQQPLRIEIGLGKGKFLYETARLNPEINFIGVELQSSVIVVLGKKLEEAPLDNLKLLRLDALKLQEMEWLKEQVEVIYLNFSDPWPKKKHAKRRLTHPNFLKSYQSILKSNGSLLMKTDNDSLFEYTLTTLSQNCWYLEEVSIDLHNSELDGGIKTEYEEKFSEKGYKIKYLKAHQRKE